MRWGLLTLLERKALNRARSKTYQRRYLAAHPERRKATSRNYYLRNKKVHTERVNRWRENNPERIREIQRAWCKIAASLLAGDMASFEHHKTERMKLLSQVVCTAPSPSMRYWAFDELQKISAQQWEPPRMLTKTD